MILEEIRRRKSVRRYVPRPVEREKLERILKAGRHAPTAKNKQEWKILIIENARQKSKLVAEASPHQPFLEQAAILLVACSLNPDYIMRCGHPAYLIDLAIVLDHISLQAVREGLGTCWIGSFYEDKVKKVLGIPPRIRIVQLMGLGYYVEDSPPTPKKPLADLFKWNQW
jgi:nitroreductase